MGEAPVAGVRIDVWLWAARWFRTRSLAKQAVVGGKVAVNGQAAKPAKPVHVGDRLVIERSSESWDVEVLALATERGAASVAQALPVGSSEEAASAVVTREPPPPSVEVAMAPGVGGAEDTERDGGSREADAAATQADPGLQAAGAVPDQARPGKGERRKEGGPRPTAKGGPREALFQMPSAAPRRVGEVPLIFDFRK